MGKPTNPRPQLRFEGMAVDDVSNKLAGKFTNGGQEYRIGDYVYVITKNLVTGVHVDDKGDPQGIVREHVMAVAGARVVPVLDGQKLLQKYSMSTVEGGKAANA